MTVLRLRFGKSTKTTKLKQQAEMVLCSITKHRGVWHGWKTLLCSKKILKLSMMDPEMLAVATQGDIVRDAWLLNVQSA